MKYKKTYNPDGSTNKIIIEKDGVYFALTPKQAAQAVLALRKALFAGILINEWS